MYTQLHFDDRSSPFFHYGITNLLKDYVTFDSTHPLIIILHFTFTNN